MSETILQATTLRLVCAETGHELDRKPATRYNDLRWSRVSQFASFKVFVDFEDGSSQPLVVVETDGAAGATICTSRGRSYFIPTKTVIRNVQACIRDLLENNTLTKRVVTLGQSGLMACYSPVPITVTGYVEDGDGDS